MAPVRRARVITLVRRRAGAVDRVPSSTVGFLNRATFPRSGVIVVSVADLQEQPERIERALPGHVPVLDVLSAGFVAYRRQVFQDVWRLHGRRFVDLWLSRVFRDASLGLPHRRILEFLAAQYEHCEQAFTEVQFSGVVRGARVSRSRAKGYLLTLERKALIQRRKDGYRVHFRLACPAGDSSGEFGGSSAPLGSEVDAPTEGTA